MTHTSIDTDFETFVSQFMESDYIPEYAKNWVVDKMEDETFSLEEIIKYMMHQLELVEQDLEQEAKEKEDDASKIIAAIELDYADEDVSMSQRIIQEAEDDMNEIADDFDEEADLWDTEDEY